MILDLEWNTSAVTLLLAISLTTRGGDEYTLLQTQEKITLKALEEWYPLALAEGFVPQM